MKQYLSKNSTVIGRRETCRPSSNRNHTVSAGVFFSFFLPRWNRAAAYDGSQEVRNWKLSEIQAVCWAAAREEAALAKRYIFHLVSCSPVVLKQQSTDGEGAGVWHLTWFCFMFCLLDDIFFSLNNWKMSNKTNHNFQKLKTTACFVPAVRKQNILFSLQEYKTDKMEHVLMFQRLFGSNKLLLQRVSTKSRLPYLKSFNLQLF